MHTEYSNTQEMTLGFSNFNQLKVFLKWYRLPVTRSGRTLTFDDVLIALRDII